MKYSVAEVTTAFVIAGTAALGGAAVVFSEFDDAPGGVLLGFVLILGAAAIALRALRRRA